MGPTPVLEGYEFVSKNRTHKLGGGVCIFVSKKLRFKSRQDLEIECDTIEHCIIELQLRKRKVLICSAYRALAKTQASSYRIMKNYPTV